MQETLQEFEHPSTYEEKIDRLIAQLRNAETADEREAATTALGGMDKRFLTPLITLLPDEQSEIRQSAALALASMGEGRDADWLVRAGALYRILNNHQIELERRDLPRAFHPLLLLVELNSVWY
jgi:HEAT repeat protein